MAYGDIDACDVCLFGVDGPSETCQDCDMGDCFTPAEEDHIRDRKYQRYMMTEAA